MAETKEPAIKLFGKTIKLPQNEEKILSVFSCRRNGTTCTIINTSYTDCSQSISHSKNELRRTGEVEEKVAEKDSSCKQHEETDDKDRGPTLISEKINPQSDSSTTFLDREIEASKSLQNEEGEGEGEGEEEESETSDSQGKITSKKPDKILPCPRCASMDTKFCYYNNYNVNQPRYFCKNCQRYWTAGGTMRNVPVGAGRRKNKKPSSSSSSHYRQINVREAQQVVGPVVGPHVFHLQILKPNGPVRTYGADGPLCESMASSLILAHRTNGNCTRNGLSVSEEHRISSVPIEESNNLEENSAKGRRISNEEKMNFHGFSQQIPLIHGPPLPYAWNSALTQPGLCTQTIPMPLYLATNFWGCPVPSSWNNPMMHPPTNPNPEAPPSYPIPSPNPQALGKHSREGELISKQSILDKEDPRRENNSIRNIWIPKTLRIDDPEEAAKSSIWSTLGIKIDNVDSISGKSLFKALRLKGDGNSHITETSQLLKANPAALSRSNKFHETS